MAPELNADTKVLTLRLAGDLTNSNAASTQAIGSLLQAAREDARAWRDVKFDLTDAKMIDSAGLNLVVAALKAVQKNGGKMQLLYRDPNVYRTLVFTRLDRRLDLVKA